MSGAVKARITKFYFGAPPEPTMNPWLPMELVAAESKNKVEIHSPINGTECTEQIASDRKNIYRFLKKSTKPLRHRTCIFWRLSVYRLSILHIFS